MKKKFLIVILRFHGDVLLTKPMIDNIKQNFSESEIDLLVYRGTGSILEHDKNISEIIEIESASKKNIFIRIKKEINLWKKLNSKNYDFAFFLTTQWRVVPMSWAIGKTRKAAVDDEKRKKNLWIRSFTTIFPAAITNHIIERNLLALESLGLTVFNKKLALDSSVLNSEYNNLKAAYPYLPYENTYCVIHPTSRREKKLWDQVKFAKLVDHLVEKDLAVIITSGPDSHEIDYVNGIFDNLSKDKNKVLNLSGKTNLLGLAALIERSNFFIGLDSVASHIAASVDKESITLFGPSNPINWKPWSDKAQIISRKELNLIEVEEVMTLVGKMTLK